MLEPARQVIEGYMSVGAVYVVIVGGASLSLFACFGIYAVRLGGGLGCDSWRRTGRRCLMVTYLVIGLILLIIFIVASGLFATWQGLHEASDPLESRRIHPNPTRILIILHILVESYGVLAF